MTEPTKRASISAAVLGLCCIFASFGAKDGAKTFERQNFDTTCAPCRDFYQFANGGWIAGNPVPSAFSRWGSFDELTDFNTAALHTILEESKAGKKGSNAQKIADFYASGMDSLQAETDGLKPIRDELARIDGLKTMADVQAAIAHLQSIGARPLFRIFSSQDDKNSTAVIAQIFQGGLGLPDRDYYTKSDDKSKQLRDGYAGHVKKMFILMGDDSAAASTHAETVLAIETELAKASITRVEMRNPINRYHKMSLTEVKKLAPDFIWEDYFKQIGTGIISEINIGQPDFIKEMNRLWTATPVDRWKAYLKWHLITMAAPFLNSALVTQDFDFFQKTLIGSKEMKPRWKRISGYTDDLLGEALGQLYTERFFNQQAKARANEMVKNIEWAFKRRLKGLTWMSDSTRARAEEKMNAFRTKIGYPDSWRDYSALEITRGPFIGNVMRANAFEFKRQLAQIGKPVDRAEWSMTPPTVNARYSAHLNDILFPAGILQYPFFNPLADDAFNYGAMGSVIGHEITHGFDDQGRQFDGQGNLRDWWKEEDGRNFVERAARVQKQFDGYTVLDSVHVNGKLTLGENIADLGGLTIAYEAFKKSLEGKPAPAKIDGFTAEQRFFLAWAQIWRTSIRDEAMRLMINTNPHAPGKFRVNGPLSNITEFAEAFRCVHGDPMVRPDSLRAVIW